MKLYLINMYQAYIAREQGIYAVRELPNETPHYKYEILQEADVELPQGFSLEQTKGYGEEIFRGDTVADMVTENHFGKHVTSLVTTDGITTLKEWDK